MFDRINNKVYAILDFDGYVCKSFYANTEDPMNLYTARNILRDLVRAAVEKTANFYNVPEKSVKVLPIMSGHTWKKDIYPSYKRARKRDEYLGVYRDEIKKLKNIIIVSQLEADDIVIILANYLENNNGTYIAFSDDKDIKYAVTNYCKVNLTEEISIQDEVYLYMKQLEQKLTGDSEDCIKGVPKIGPKTATKLLEQLGYSINSVVKIYKDKQIEIDNCLRDLVLVSPIVRSMYTDMIAESILDDKQPKDIDVINAIIEHVKSYNKTVTEVYDDEEKS